MDGTSRDYSDRRAALIIPFMSGYDITHAWVSSFEMLRVCTYLEFSIQLYTKFEFFRAQRSSSQTNLLYQKLVIIQD